MQFTFNTATDNLNAEPDGEDRILINTGGTEFGSHVLETADRCLQLFAYIVVLGLDLGETREPLIRGSLLHAGLAHHYVRRGAQQAEGVDFDGSIYKDPDQFYEPLDAVTRAGIALVKDGEDRMLVNHLVPMVQERIQQYIDYYRGRDQFRILFVEKLFKTTIHGYPYTCRMDLGIDIAHQGTWMVDHKGAARITKSHEIYSPSLQVQGLQLFGRQNYGERFKGVILNYVSWSDVHFERRPPTPAPAFASRIEQSVFDIWSSLHTLLGTKRDPWKWPVRYSGCIDKWGKLCPGYKLCMDGRPPYDLPARPNEAVLRVLRSVTKT